MSKPEVLEKSPMNIVEVKEALEKIRAVEEGVELNFRAAKTEEYAQDFAKLKPKQAKELYEKIMGMDIPRLKEQHAHKLIDLLPQSEKSVKLILTSYHLTVTNENIKKLAETITEYADKRK